MHASIKTNVNKFAFFKSFGFEISYTGSEIPFEAYCEYELHISPNTKVNTAKDHGDDYMKVRPPFVHHLLRNRLLGKRWQTTSDFCVIFTMCLCGLKVPMKKKIISSYERA